MKSLRIERGVMDGLCCSKTCCFAEDWGVSKGVTASEKIRSINFSTFLLLFIPVSPSLRNSNIVRRREDGEEIFVWSQGTRISIRAQQHPEVKKFEGKSSCQNVNRKNRGKRPWILSSLSALSQPEYAEPRDFSLKSHLLRVSIKNQ